MPVPVSQWSGSYYHVDCVLFINQNMFWEGIILVWSPGQKVLYIYYSYSPAEELSTEVSIKQSICLPLMAKVIKYLPKIIMMKIKVLKTNYLILLKQGCKEVLKRKILQ